MLLSVNVGLPKDVPWRGKAVFTGVFKDPVGDRRRVSRLNIEGDGQGDLAGHGGEQRAVFVYQLDSYRYWERELGRNDSVYGQFGENFTVDGLSDDEVCVGDRYRIGTAVFEVSQPRVTCFRVGIRMSDPRLPALLVSHHRPGFYFRVLEEGEVQAGDDILRLEAGPERMTVAELDALLYLPGHPRQQLLRALRIPALSPGWQASFRALLEGSPGRGNAGLAVASPPPAWAGFRPLTIAAIGRESDSVISIRLQAPDGAPLPAARPGQYVTVRVQPDPGQRPLLRNYSLSGSAAAGTYRITVKHEEHGAVSGYLHSGLQPGDRLDVAAPRGAFILDQTEAPVLLITAGIGATPALAMLHALAESHSERELWWVHGARSSREHSFAAEARALLATLPNAQAHVYYSHPEPGDVEGRDFDSPGRLTAPALAELEPPRNAEAYVCGPAAFMQEISAALAALGLDASRIHTEPFGPASAQTNVLTWHNDNLRTGLNSNEVILTPANVRSSTFGLRFNFIVDGNVDAEPLYVMGVRVSTNAVHNVIYVVTENNSVYAIDADTGHQYWRVSALVAGEVSSDDRDCDMVTPQIGITVTPVIDLKSGPHGTIYFVSMSKDSSGKYHHRVHAMDLITGAEEFGGPREVQATYPGKGENSSNGRVVFDPAQYKDRPSLLLVNGVIYTSWSSHCDRQPYTSWIMGYNETNLQQTGVINFTPNGAQGGMWNAGAGPAADAQGNIYMALGNGTFDTTTTASGFPDLGDYGNALVKVNMVNGKLSVVDYWTMYNTVDESEADLDLSSGGTMLLPDMKDSTGKTRHLAVTAGKDTHLYVVDRDKMGHFHAGSNATVYQDLTGPLPGGVWASPAYFNNQIYYGSRSQPLVALQISSARVSSSPFSSTEVAFVYPGTTPSVSAYGNTNGIVWAAKNTQPTVLYAYDARNLNTELYGSDQAPHSAITLGTEINSSLP